MASKSTPFRANQKWRHRRLNAKRIFSASLGSLIGISIIAYLSTITGRGFLIPPLGASCFIAFVIPDSAFARPQNIIGGHLLASTIGIIFFHVLGADWWSLTLAVSATVAIMQILRISHPPAASDPLLLMMQESVSLDILSTVLGGSIILSLIAVLFNNLITQHRYYRIILLIISKLYTDNAKRFSLVTKFS